MKSKQLILKYWRVLLFLLLLIGFFSYFINNPDNIPRWETINWNYFLWVILMSGLANIIAGIAYYIVVSKTQSNLRLQTVLRAFIISRTINLFAPQGGTVYRAIALNKLASFSYSNYSATISACLWLDLFLAAPLTVFILLFTPNSLARDQLIFGFLLCWGLLLLGAVLLVIWNRCKLLNTLSFLSIRVRMHLSNIANTLASLIKNPKLILQYGSLVSVGNILNGFRFSLCFVMVGSSVSWSNAFAIGVIVKACNMFSVTPGNLGVIEGVVGVLGAQIGLTLGTAVLAGLAYRFASYIALFFMSLILLIKPT